MATKSEQKKAETEIANARRKAGAKKTPKRSSKKKTASRSKDHAGRKATYALEEGTARPSRKSTRKSANRSKPDAALVAREELKKTSPSARYSRARARSR